MYFANNENSKKPIYDKCVLKVGYAHAGYGKSKITNNSQYEDTLSIIQMYGDYFTAEPFVDYVSDIRVQKIGNHIRAFERKPQKGNWKANVGEAIVNDIKVDNKLKFYINESSKLFGGLDICALDVLKDKDGNYHILELNDSAIGLNKEHEKEDNLRIIKDVIKKMNKTFQ